MGDALVTLSNVSVRFGSASILESISCHIDAGQVTALIGPNGSGKTTLLKAMLGVVPFTGRIEWHVPRKSVGYVPQRLDVERSLPVTVADFVAGMTKRRLAPLGMGSALVAFVRSALERAGAERLMQAQLGELSGGELQRVMLAVALEPMPRLLLLDEPASGLDFSGEALMYEIVSKLVREHGVGVVLVSHDLSIVSNITQHVLCVNRTLVCEGGPESILTDANIASVFGAGHGVYRHDHHHGGEDHSTHRH